MVWYPEPIEIKIEDEGHLHVGHAGAKSGGHFKLFIVSKQFNNMSQINRHKLVYKTLDTLLKTEIHALSLEQKLQMNYNFNLSTNASSLPF